MMGWIEALTGLLSIGSGGVFGTLISLGGNWLKFKQQLELKKLEREERQADRAHELELQKLNMQARAQETEQELAIVSQQGAWQGLTTSVQHDMSVRDSYPWVNAVRALFRPFLTISLWVMAVLVFYRVANGDMKEWIGPADVAELVRYMVYSVFFTAASAFAWWFGDRTLVPPGWKNR